MKSHILCRSLLGLSAFLSLSCGTSHRAASVPEHPVDRGCLTLLPDSLFAGTKGEVGVAVLTSEGDTLVGGADACFPLMSVFKLHEAIAVAHVLDTRGQDLDTVLHIRRDELNPHTWSPMLKDYPEGDLDMSVGELMAYMLIHSDNNASNLLFDRIVSVSGTDSLVRALTPISDFRLRHTEAEMLRDHDLAYGNWSSPLACAVLIDRVFTDSLVSGPKQGEIRRFLGECKSAPGRIAAALDGEPGTRMYHRTGSGFTNDRGEVAAVNDVAWVSLPDGRHYSLAILVKDYPGPQEEADSMIAAIAGHLHRQLAAHPSR